MAKKQTVRKVRVKLNSNTENKKLYTSIVQTILAYLKEKDGKNQSIQGVKIEYFGDTLENEEFEIKEGKDGEKYYAY